MPLSTKKNNERIRGIYLQTWDDSSEWMSRICQQPLQKVTKCFFLYFLPHPTLQKATLEKAFSSKVFGFFQHTGINTSSPNSWKMSHWSNVSHNLFIVQCSDLNARPALWIFLDLLRASSGISPSPNCFCSWMSPEHLSGHMQSKQFS